MRYSVKAKPEQYPVHQSLRKRISIIRKSEIQKAENPRSETPKIRDSEIRVVIPAFGIFGALGRVISSVTRRAGGLARERKREGEIRPSLSGPLSLRLTRQPANAFSPSHGSNKNKK